MNKNDEIIKRLSNIEAIIEDIYEEIKAIRMENEDRSLEQFHVMSRIENIADFVKSRYNVLLEENEKFMVETMENINKIWYSNW